MTLKNTVGTLTQTAVSTATTAVLHPFGTAARATGLVKDTAGAGIGLVRNRIGGSPQQAPTQTQEGAPETSTATQSPVEGFVAEVREAAVNVTEKAADTAKEAAQDVTEKAADTAKVVTEKAAEQAVTVKEKTADKADEVKEAAPAEEDPRDHIPGPDLAPYVPPAPDDLPEPIVIVAE